MSAIDLTTNVGTFLKLREPFWIASSHFTEKDAILKQWIELEPAAITLKTCTKGERTESNRSIRRKTLDIVPRFGRSYYCDGSKKKELHSYEETRELLKFATKHLESTLVGISVLSTPDEKFDELRAECDGAAFCELNLKYSLRHSEADQDFFADGASKWQKTLEIITEFTKSFANFPVFIKISRELKWLPGTKQCEALIAALSQHGKAGLIVANSLKMDLAKLVHENQETELGNGVLMGDAIYDDTISMIEDFRAPCEAARVPIIATGGMVDEQQVLMALRSGAEAVQLCTAFEYNKLGFYRTLGSALTARIKWRGLKDFKEFLPRIREEGIASIYSMPFMYHHFFWADEIQKEIQLDIRFSERMDAVVMSGSTLLEKWEQSLKARLKAGRSVQLFIPNPEGAMFTVIQKAWGLADHEVEVRRKRATGTKEKMLAWLATEQQSFDPHTERGVYYYNQCPFYSFYLFDDKVYLAQYPFMRPDRLASPVYVFYRSSPEYDRLDKELQALKAAVEQTEEPASA